MVNPSSNETIWQAIGGVFSRASKFINESWQELQKCAWPSKDELTKSTMMVLASLLVVTIWIGGLDYMLGLITKHIVGW